MIFSTVAKVKTLENRNSVNNISRNYRISKQCCKFLQIFIGLPVAVFVVMGARELLPFFDGLVGNLEVLLVHLKEKQWLINPTFFLFISKKKLCTLSVQNQLGGGSTLYVMALYPIWILVSVICAPFFILYVAARNVYYKVHTPFES